MCWKWEKCSVPGTRDALSLGPTKEFPGADAVLCSEDFFVPTCTNDLAGHGPCRLWGLGALMRGLVVFGVYLGAVGHADDVSRTLMGLSNGADPEYYTVVLPVQGNPCPI